MDDIGGAPLTLTLHFLAYSVILCIYNNVFAHAVVKPFEIESQGLRMRSSGRIMNSDSSANQRDLNL